MPNVAAPTRPGAAPTHRTHRTHLTRHVALPRPRATAALPTAGAAHTCCILGAADDGLKRPPPRPSPARAARAAGAGKWSVKRAGADGGGQGARGGNAQRGARGHGRSVEAFNREISRLGKKGDWEGAVAQLEEMQRAGVRPTPVSYNAAMSALTKGGQWKMAVDMFDRVFGVGTGDGADKLQPDSFSFAAVISACGRGRMSNKAQRYFEAMAPAKVEANEFTYSSLMTAMERSQEPERALAAFERMQLQGIKPNVYTYTSAISACEKVSVHACLYECLHRCLVMPASVNA